MPVKEQCKWSETAALRAPARVFVRVANDLARKDPRLDSVDDLLLVFIRFRSAIGHVREAFAENFSRGREVGAACCVYHTRERVIDLWGGVRNKSTGDPWEQDTMALV